jgi:hypothetical protein
MGLRSGALGFGAIFGVAGPIVAVADHALDVAGVKADSNVGYFAQIIAGLSYAFIPWCPGEKWIQQGGLRSGVAGLFLSSALIGLTTGIAGRFAYVNDMLLHCQRI